MMTTATRHPDIIFITEYIKNALYFATVRHEKVLKSTSNMHYFTTDDELIYENYYSDFGPLNLGCVYKFCKLLNDKLKTYLNKQTIVYYSSIDPKKKANAAFLLGCYGVLYLSLTPRDALKPLILHGQSYRPFQDASQGESIYTISLMDCLSAIKRARELDFFNFQDFNYEEYERLDRVQGGDLNWIVPGKFLAFIGPVDYSVSLHHPPEMYIDYFRDNNVTIVIRLNKRMYDANVFNNVGIIHYDLFFPDGSCPPRHILLKFLQIAETSDGAIAVHCKAGLGRTGSLIGCYLIKHYRMTAHEAIGWMRICRPGSVIGHQQGWLEHLEPWLTKQGNLYRKRTFQDTEKFPIHEFGIYSLSEKMLRQKSMVMSKSPSPPPPINRRIRSDITAPVRPQASKIREGQEVKEETDAESDESDESTETETETETSRQEFKTVEQKDKTFTRTGACIHEHYDDDDEYLQHKHMSFWKKYFCCYFCKQKCTVCLYSLSVHCANCTPKGCKVGLCCLILDRAAPSKVAEKDPHHAESRVKSSKLKLSSPNSKVTNKSVRSRDQLDVPKTVAARRNSGGGEPRPVLTSRPSSRANTVRLPSANIKDKTNGSSTAPIPTFRTTQGPLIKTLSEAKNFLMKSSCTYGKQHYDKPPSHYSALNQAISVTPHYTSRLSNYTSHYISGNSIVMQNPANSSVPFQDSRGPMARRRLGLGRSPSPSPSPSPTRLLDHSRATNTMAVDKVSKVISRDSKSTLREALSRLKLSMPARDRSICAASVGAASLGARRDAPAGVAKRAPSVRSDERPLATQGDMLNSIKFQKRFRDALNVDKFNTINNEKLSMTSKPTLLRPDNSKGGASTAKALVPDFSISPREKGLMSTSKFFSSPRPTSPKGRNRTSS